MDGDHDELIEAPAPKPLIVEVRANENRRRLRSEAVPYTVEQVIEDALQCADAGAAVYHFHARTPNGEAAHDVGFYRDVMVELTAKTDMIVHPTTGFTDEKDPANRVRPIVELAANSAVRLETAAIAFGVTNLDRWDAHSGMFIPGDLVYLNTRNVLDSVLSAYSTAELPVISVCWELSHIRTALQYRAAGRYEHRLWQFALTAGGLLATGAPTIRTLSAMVDAIPAGEEWMVWCQGGDVMPLAAHAAAMGAHVGIGLGDHHYGGDEHATNVALVQRVAQLAGLVGRPLATPAQARELLHLPAPESR